MFVKIRSCWPILKFKWFYVIFCTLFTSCVEPFEFEFDTFENYLVVEAVITDEFKNHEIKLSRTTELEGEVFNFETGAIVFITDSNNETFNFTESTSGLYVSENKFKVVSGTEYQLHIETNDGQKYQSSNISLPPAVQIDNLYAERLVDDDGDLVLGFFVNTSSNSSESIFIRYEYEEAYKIVAPYWNEIDLIEVQTLDPPEFFPILPIYAPRSESEAVCYNTKSSDDFILANSNKLLENRILNFPLQFVAADNIGLVERYCFSVKQFSISSEAYIFYEKLKSFSNGGNLFSQVQTGFVSGNISSVNKENNKVLGFFDISRVQLKRLYVKGNDFFTSEELFQYVCEVIVPTPNLFEPIPDFVVRVNRDFIPFFKYYGTEESLRRIGLFKLVKGNCGDCTFFKTTEKPYYWED